MEVVTVLAIAFILSTVISRLVKKQWNVIFSGNLAMCIMLCFTAIGHVIYAKGMTMMLPDFIPFKLGIVYVTGIMEVIFGILLLGPKYRRKTGIAIIIFFILILPANIYEAVNYVNLEAASYDGVGPIYLWFRIPLQLFLIGWVYFFSVRRGTQELF